MGTSLRGELTRTSRNSSAKQPAIETNLESIQGMLEKFVHLSTSQSSKSIPSITVTNPPSTKSDKTNEAAAPWSWTVAEAASTEAVLHPFLAHLATAKNDVEALTNCLDAADGHDDNPGKIAGGLVNSVDHGSGHSLLHIAAMNGHNASANVLLKHGALVHLRDTLGHTALYYVCCSSVFGASTNAQIFQLIGCTTRTSGHRRIAGIRRRNFQWCGQELCLV